MQKRNIVITLFACALLMSCGNSKSGDNTCTVSFETNGGSTVAPVQVIKGHRLKKPANPTSDIATFDMWYNEKRLVTPYDFFRPVVNDMTLYAKWINNIFSIKAGILTNLTVTGEDDEPLEDVRVLENNDLKLKINVTGDTNLYIPPAMSIVINKRELVRNEYAIDYVDGSDYKSAYLTIFGQNVTSDITISGEAFDYNTKYVCAASSYYGLKSDSYYVVANKNEDAVLKFYATEDYSLPAIENILICVDNSGEWVNPTSNETSNVDAQFIYSKTNTEVSITIKPNNQTLNYVDIKLRAPEYRDVLDEFTWEQISQISKQHETAKYFYIGDTKHVIVNNCEHRVRIIGFDHDELADGSGKKAGITFEFENVISKENGTYVNYGSWGSDKNTDFANSTLNGALNSAQGCVLSLLPMGLREVIVPVKKPYVKNGALSSYNTNLFVLSKTELNGDTSSGVYVPSEGVVYPFYNFGDPTDTWNEIRYKFDPSGGNCPYWTRTPSNISDTAVWLTKQSTSPETNFITVDSYYSYNDIAVAPAFCV